MTGEPLDNDTLWKLYSPKPNPWFSSEITYEGWGIATFEKPAGTVEGPTKIVVDETGKLQVEMECELTENVAFLKSRHSLHLCSKLTVETETGIFTSDGKVYCLPYWDKKLQFDVSEGIFDVNSARTAKYWVVPLINFISHFRPKADSVLTQHPLRLFSIPVVPEVLDEKQKELALSIANSRANSLICFYLGEKLGYIQPLFDYAEKEENLKSRRSNQSITALMVGEITDSINETGFPYDYMKILTLASETKVGAGWVEFRDEDGKLVRVRYIVTEQLTYQRRYPIIDELFSSGISPFLTAAFNSPELRKGYCRTLVRNLIELSSSVYNYEYKMVLIGSGLDSLCKESRITGGKIDLPDKYLIQVNLILEEAGEKLRPLLEKAKRESLVSDNALVSLIDRVKGVANNKDGNFGLKVSELLKRFNFIDGEVMEKYNPNKPEPKITWFQTIAWYRNIVIHEGYFPENIDTDDISEVEDHLHDIMVRIFLRILNYQGKYQPCVRPYILPDGRTVDWVNSQTTALDLGYRG